VRPQARNIEIHPIGTPDARFGDAYAVNKRHAIWTASLGR
jgi:hypothetical protein